MKMQRNVKWRWRVSKRVRGESERLKYFFDLRTLLSFYLCYEGAGRTSASGGRGTLESNFFFFFFKTILIYVISYFEVHVIIIFLFFYLVSKRRTFDVILFFVK